MKMKKAFGLIATLLLVACGKSTEQATAPPPAPLPPPATAPLALAPPPVVAAAPSPQQVAPPPMPAPTPVLVPTNKAPVWTAIPAPAAINMGANAAGKVLANFKGLEAEIPSNWKPTQPDNSMRLAQYEAPVPGKAPAEIVVFFFPPGNGGTQEDNINRWTSQFSDGKGGPVKPILHRTSINGMPITRAELNGHYARGVGMGAEGTAQPNQTLIAAIITTPAQGNVTLHIYGPKEVVNHHRKAFDEILASIRFKG